MSKTASIDLPSTNTLFGRLMASVDRFLTRAAPSPFATVTSPISVSDIALAGSDLEPTSANAGIPTNGPGSRGHFHLNARMAGAIGTCDKLAGPLRANKNRLQAGISYTRMVWTLA
jgi:hypothetical protein